MVQQYDENLPDQPGIIGPNGWEPLPDLLSPQPAPAAPSPTPASGGGGALGADEEIHNPFEVTLPDGSIGHTVYNPRTKSSRVVPGAPPPPSTPETAPPPDPEFRKRVQAINGHVATTTEEQPKGEALSEATYAVGPVPDPDVTSTKFVPDEPKTPTKTSSQQEAETKYTPPVGSSSVIDSAYVWNRPSRAAKLTPPSTPRNDPTLVNNDFQLNRYTNPAQRPPGSEAALGTVLDISANMYRAQRAGTTTAPPTEIPAEEKAIIGAAISALAKGRSDDPSQPLPEWVSNVLYNAGRAAWQADRGNFRLDAKYADPRWVQDWVNSFLRGSTHMPLQAAFAEDIRKTGNPAPADIVASASGPKWVASTGRDIVAASLTEPQTADTLKKYGVDPAFTWEVCGPIAASALLKGATGDDRYTFGKVFNEARAGGFWGDIGDGNGWRGPDKMAEFLRNHGVAAEAIANADTPDTLRTIIHDTAKGKVTSITNGTHYFVISDYNPETQAFYVGTTGEALRRGKRWMTAQEMKDLGDGRFTAIRVLEDPRTDPSAPPPMSPRTAAPAPRLKPPEPDQRVYSYSGPVDYSSHNSRNGTEPGEIEAFARKAAVQRGIDPNFAMWLIDNEGGSSNPVKQNDHGVPVYGPLQLHVAGVGAEFKQFMKAQYGVDADVRDPRWWKAATEFAFDTAAKARNWKPWEAATARGREHDGFLDPKPIGISSEALIYAGYTPAIQAARLRGS